MQYNDIIVTTTTPNLLHLKIPRLFHKEKQTRRYKYEIGDLVKKYNDSMKILQQIKIKYNNSSARGYKVECLDCHYIYNCQQWCVILYMFLMLTELSQNQVIQKDLCTQS